MFLIKMNGKYLTMAGKWTDKKKDARRFTNKNMAMLYIRMKQIDAFVIGE